MRYIIAVSTLDPIYILMVGFTLRLRTSLCCLRLFMCKIVLPRVFVSCRISDVLCRLYLDFSPVWMSVYLFDSQTCLVVCLVDPCC